MLQTCGDSLVSAAMSSDTAAVARRTGDVLGWTSHLGEVAQSLIEHCHHSARKRYVFIMMTTTTIMMLTI
jgi:hypothetical protein